jgi:predicted nucleic acid-binding Zn ribbon protein
MQHAGLGLEKLVAGSLRRAPQGEAPLLAWPLVCGSSVAERTRAVSFVDGVLRVEVADAGWKRELQTLAPRYLAALNRYAGQNVNRIEFVVDATADAAGPALSRAEGAPAPHHPTRHESHGKRR